MSAVYNDKKKYAKNTLGYHYGIANVVFSGAAAPLEWLQKKANESLNGFDELVIQHESQVMYLCCTIRMATEKG